MVKDCCVYKCRNRKTGLVEEQGIHFFRFPVNHRKRAAWKRAINRKDWSPGKHSYVCSAHFESGWHFDDPRDKDYAPNKFPSEPLPEKHHESFHHRRTLGMAFDEAANLQINMENKKLAQSLEFHEGYICKYYNKLQKPEPRKLSWTNDSVKEKVPTAMVGCPKTRQSKDSKTLIVKMFSKNRLKQKKYSKNKSMCARTTRSSQAITESATETSSPTPTIDVSQDDIHMKNTTNSGTMTDSDHLLVENERLKKENELLKEKLVEARLSSRCSWCYRRQ